MPTSSLIARARRGLTTVVIVTLSTGVFALPSASAAPATPRGLSPESSVSTNSPVLAWNRVAGAAKYEVQVAKTPDFAAPVFSIATTNRQSVPTSSLPDGSLHWRVRAVSSSGSAGAWATQAFDVSPTAAPELVAPADGSDLAQPADPPLLAWTAVQGATKYEIEIDTEDDFIGATLYSTKTPSFVLPDTKEPRTYFWRVRAIRANGLTTLWSAPRSYNILALSDVTLAYPADNADSSIEDVFLDWDPVPGATKYEVRVSTDQQFNTITDSKIVMSTRYSPLVTYLNNQYYWQVRALNAAGLATNWKPVPAMFRRHWPDKPTLRYPANQIGQPVGDDFYYEWTPVDHATRYQLDVGTDPNFSPGTFDTCYTAGTTYAAGYLKNPTDRCMPSQGTVYYWRVRALDEPADVQGIFSDIHTFIYNSGNVNQTSPSNGQTVPVPTLRWEAAQNAEKYRVQILNSTGAEVAKTDTYALSWTPTGTKALDPSKGPFSWTVQAIDSNGSVSPKYAGWQFSLAGTPSTSAASPLSPITGVAGDLPTNRFPMLSWEPLPGAAYYKIKIGVSGSGFWFNTSHSPILNQSFPYNAATDTGKAMLAPGRYDWQVQAFAADNSSLGSGSVGTFRIVDLAPVVGQQIAINGTSLDAGRACSAFLDDPSSDLEICAGVPTTPVLDWAPVPEASHYMIYLAQDREFTNMVYSAIPETTNTRWTPTWSSAVSALADSQAGKAYYWFVRPCKATGVCAPDPISTNKAATHAFDKKSPAVTLESPADHSVAADDVTFRWDDYSTTNEATTYPETGEASTQTAKQYRIQVSTSDTFTTLLDNRIVDQATYTPYDKTYPEGDLYWRVKAIDGQGNELTWSETRIFTKKSLAPDLLAPSGNTDGTSPFRWEPTDYAGSYKLEVYKNNDEGLSAVNRVLSMTSKQTALSPTSPLATSPQPYLWRVQRVDAAGKPGPWSSIESFYVKGLAPEHAFPGDSANMSSRDPLFAWGVVPGATSYKFERRSPKATSNTETISTDAVAWAPTKAIENGTWEWRVTAYDVNRSVLGISPWSTFYVDTVRPRVVSRSPMKSAARTANFVAKFSEPVINVSRSTMKLFVKGRQDALTARVSLSADGRTATLNPKQNLRAGKLYTLKLSTGITDHRGNSLRATSWSATAR